MKQLIAAIAATVFIASVNADDVYKGLAKGNAELHDGHYAGMVMAGSQPGIGNSVDVYGEFADGNPDLFKRESGPFPDAGDFPDFFEAVKGNPDL
jgi:hypothetical protein